LGEENPARESAMSDITLLLEAIRHGKTGAAGDLLALVYAELRQIARAKMAREQPGQTLQPTALVHEAWLRLGEVDFENRAHFFAAAAEAMRRILVDVARRKRSARRGSGEIAEDIADLQIAAPSPDDELLAVHEALEALALHDPQKAELVKLRYFVGMSIAEAASALGISERTAKRNWTYSRAWLLDAMRADGA
jgi:RNA polymerase sigma factor (TIGR02999 family)